LSRSPGQARLRASVASRDDDRLFNPHGRKHFRRTYSRVEVRYSLAVVGMLAATGAWVAWRGAHPDPELLALESDLLAEGTEDAPLRARKLATGTAPASAGEGDGHGQSDGTAGGAAAGAARGPVPDGLAAPGWRERSVTAFERDNLYEKINGRAGYYESFGVERLHFITLVHGEDEALTVDIEMYDMGKLANALGAYGGERQPDAAPALVDGSLGHTARNAAFLVRGRFYVRAIGADESEPVLAQLAHLQRALAAGIEAEPLPWAYALFVAAGADPGKVGFLPENAFSFGFARNVYTAAVNDDGAELYTVATTDEAAARALVTKFAEGFQSYGKDAGRADGIQWVEDQYLGTLAGATTRGALVLGIRGAPDRPFAGKALAELVRAAEALPESVRAQATAEAGRPAPVASSGYDDDAAEPGAAEPGAAEPGAAPSHPEEDDREQ
jgi:hypothetical protein